jgi:hypothetical protein
MAVLVVQEASKRMAAIQYLVTSRQEIGARLRQTEVALAAHLVWLKHAAILRAVTLEARRQLLQAAQMGLRLEPIMDKSVAVTCALIKETLAPMVCMGSAVAAAVVVLAPKHASTTVVVVAAAAAAAARAVPVVKAAGVVALPLEYSSIR